MKKCLQEKLPPSAVLHMYIGLQDCSPYDRLQLYKLCTLKGLNI